MGGFVMPVRAHLRTYRVLDYVNHGLAEGVRLDCSFGVSPFGMPDSVIAARSDPEESTAYPPYPYRTFLDALRDRWLSVVDLTDDMVMVSAGSMIALERLCAALLDPGDKVLGFSPQFPQFVNYIRRAGATHIAVDQGSNVEPDDAIRELSEAVQQGGYKTVYVDNPNNPTGCVYPLSAIRELCAAARANGTAVIIDEAYGDFIDDAESSLALVEQFENLFVLRSFSKAYAMAGVRIGYLVGDRSAIAWLRVFDDMLVSTQAVIMGTAALWDSAFIQEIRHVTRQTKSEVCEIVREAGYLHSATDLRTPILALTHPDDATDLYELLIRSGIKTSRGFEGVGINTVRLMVPRDTSQLQGLLPPVVVA